MIDETQTIPILTVCAVYEDVTPDGEVPQIAYYEIRNGSHVLDTGLSNAAIGGAIQLIITKAISSATVEYPVGQLFNPANFKEGEEYVELTEFDRHENETSSLTICEVLSLYAGWQLSDDPHHHYAVTHHILVDEIADESWQLTRLANERQDALDRDIRERVRAWYVHSCGIEWRAKAVERRKLDNRILRTASATLTPGII